MKYNNVLAPSVAVVAEAINCDQAGAGGGGVSGPAHGHHQAAGNE